MPLERRGDRLDQKRHRRELDAAVGVVGLALLAHVFELGDVGVVEVRELRNRRVRLDHVAGDRLPHPRHLFDPHAAEVVGVGRAGRRDAARRAWRRLARSFRGRERCTSSAVMRPPSPVGRTRRRSTPSCRASRRTAGPAAATRGRRPARRRRHRRSAQPSWLWLWSPGRLFFGVGFGSCVGSWRLRLRASSSRPPRSGSARLLFVFFRLRGLLRLCGALGFSFFAAASASVFAAVARAPRRLRSP